MTAGRKPKVILLRRWKILDFSSVVIASFGSILSHYLGIVVFAFIAVWLSGDIVRDDVYFRWGFTFFPANYAKRERPFPGLGTDANLFPRLKILRKALFHSGPSETKWKSKKIFTIHLPWTPPCFSKTLAYTFQQHRTETLEQHLTRIENWKTREGKKERIVICAWMYATNEMGGGFRCPNSARFFRRVVAPFCTVGKCGSNFKETATTKRLA